MSSWTSPSSSRVSKWPAKGYYESRIPSPADSEIGRVVRAFTESGPHDQAQLRASLDADRAGLLQVWSERIAALAVRLDSQQPLVLGLVGLSLAAGEDAHEAALVAPLHRRSAEKLGVDASGVFDDARGVHRPGRRGMARGDARLGRAAGGRGLRRGRRRRRLPLPARPGARSRPLVDADPARRAPREPQSRTEVHRVAEPGATRVAGYLAEPGEVGRVLLLYSGGLDTSVMLKWIQDEYEAEVVTLTVNLGQPGEDYEVVRGKAERLGALDAHVVDAREEFATEYVLRAIKANADYGDGYPLFTALGRPLIAKLAVEYARRTGCDTIAHGCTGKGNDQVAIESTVATLAPELKVIARCAPWAMGRDEEIAYARKHGIPVKGGTEAAPYSIDDNLWGRSSEGRWIEDLSHAPDDDVFQLVTRPELAPDEPHGDRGGFESGVPVSLDRERLGLVDLLERPAARHGARGGDRRPHRGPHRGPQGARHLRGAGRRDPADRAPRARAPGRARPPPEPVQARARPRKWAYLRLRRAVVGAAARRHRGLRRPGQRARDGDHRAQAVQGQRQGCDERRARHAVYDAQLATFADSGGLFSQSASPGVASSCGPCSSRMACRLREDKLRVKTAHATTDSSASQSGRG